MIVNKEKQKMAASLDLLLTRQAVELLIDIVAADLDIYTILKLLFERILKLIISLEILRISKFKPDLFPGILVKSVE